LDNKDRETGEWMLSDEQIAEIESNKDDKYWWRVYGEGKVGQLEGLIFPDFEQVDDLPSPEERPDGMVEAYGLDFGFTNDPSVLIHVLVDNRSREIWADEVFYRTGMLNSDMAAAMKEAGVGRKTVYADASEPKTIEELRRYGFNVQPCYKSTRKAEQLQAMKGYRQKITKRSLNLIREHRGYTWQRDKDGSYLNEPIGVQDHAEDALRYGCFPALKAYRESRRIISLT
jgi:phage terminase large subunit